MFVPIFIKSTFMESANDSTKTYWIITLISLVACILLLAFLPQFFWISLPFLFTYGVKAFGAM